MHLNICQDIATHQKQELLSGSDACINETVLAKLLKLGYVRHTMRTQGNLAAYPLFLTCLFRRPHQAPNLTLQVAREVLLLAENHETMLYLCTPACLDALVRVLSRPNLDDKTVYFVGLALQVPTVPTALQVPTALP